jgi:hypothetical protein
VLAGAATRVGSAIFRGGAATAAADSLQGRICAVSEACKDIYMRRPGAAKKPYVAHAKTWKFGHATPENGPGNPENRSVTLETTQNLLG